MGSSGLEICGVVLITIPSFRTEALRTVLYEINYGAPLF